MRLPARQFSASWTARAFAALCLLATLLGCGDAATSTDAPQSQSSAPAAAPPPRRSLAAATPTAPGTTPLDRLERIDLRAAHHSGEVTFETDDPAFLPRIPLIIDGSTDSMARSEAVNPLSITLTFKTPVRLAAARVFPAASPCDWLLEPTPGGSRLLLSRVADDTFSQIDVDPAVSTSVIRIEVLRLERDDYVHVKEIELYTAP